MAKQKKGNIGLIEDVITGSVELADINASGAAASFFLKIDAGGTVLEWSAGTGAGANDLGELTDVAAVIGTEAGKLLIGQGAVYDDKAVTGDVTIDLDGLTTIGALKVLAGMLAVDSVTRTKIKNGEVINGKLGLSPDAPVNPLNLIDSFQLLFLSCVAPSLGAESGDEVEVTYTVADVGGGNVATDTGCLADIVVSDSATDPTPSDDTTLEQGAGSLLLAGATTAQAICSMNASGDFVFKVKHTAGAGTKHLWLRAARGSTVYLRHAVAPNAVVFA